MFCIHTFEIFDYSNLTLTILAQKEFEERDFYKNEALHVAIDGSITEMEQNAFYGWYYLTTVHIGDSVISIGDYAFWECDQLSSVIIGENVKTIGNFTFSSGFLMTNITIPKSVESIGDAAFLGVYFEHIKVSDESTYYSSKDGVLIIKIFQKLFVFQWE